MGISVKPRKPKTKKTKSPTSPRGLTMFAKRGRSVKRGLKGKK